MQLREKDEHLLALRSQLDSSERASYEFSKKCDARETELNQVRQQNDEMQKRIVTQEAQLQSLENELRIAHSDDALTKVELQFCFVFSSTHSFRQNTIMNESWMKCADSIKSSWMIYLKRSEHSKIS